MAPNHALTVRLTAPQYRLLGRLSQKLGIGKTDVLRFALTRLAEAEGLSSTNGAAQPPSR
jgi:hypothetical protein